MPPLSAAGARSTGLACASAILVACASAVVQAPAPSPVPPAPPGTDRPSAVRVPVPGRSYEVGTGPGGAQYIVSNGVRATFHGAQVEVGLDAFASDIVQAVALENGGWVFVSRDGVVAHAEGFTGPMTVRGESTRDVGESLGERAPLRRRGRAVIGLKGTSFETTDGAGTLTVVDTLPRPVTWVEFFDARRGLARTDDLRLVYTADSGATWRVLPLAGAAAVPWPTDEGWVVAVRGADGAAEFARVGAAGDVTAASTPAGARPGWWQEMSDETAASLRDALEARWPEVALAGPGALGPEPGNVAVTLRTTPQGMRLVRRSLADGRVISDEAVALAGAQCDAQRWGARAALARCALPDHSQAIQRVGWSDQGNETTVTPVATRWRRGLIVLEAGHGGGTVRAAWLGDCDDPHWESPLGVFDARVCVAEIPAGGGHPALGTMRVPMRDASIQALVGDDLMLQGDGEDRRHRAMGVVGLRDGAFHWLPETTLRAEGPEVPTASATLDGRAWMIFDGEDPAHENWSLRVGTAPDALRPFVAPHAVRAIQMLDLQRGVGFSEPDVVWFTADGGAHWQHLDEAQPAAGPNASGPDDDAVLSALAQHGSPSGNWIARWGGALTAHPVLARRTQPPPEPPPEPEPFESLACTLGPAPRPTPALHAPGPRSAEPTFAAASDGAVLAASTWALPGGSERTQWAWWGRDARGAFHGASAAWPWERSVEGDGRPAEFAVLAAGRAGALLGFCGAELVQMERLGGSAGHAHRAPSGARHEPPCGMVWLTPGRLPLRVEDPALPPLTRTALWRDASHAWLAPDGGILLQTVGEVFSNEVHDVVAALGPDLRVRGLAFGDRVQVDPDGVTRERRAVVGYDARGAAVFAVSQSVDPEGSWHTRAFTPPGSIDVPTETAFSLPAPIAACTVPRAAGAVTLALPAPVSSDEVPEREGREDAGIDWTAVVELTPQGGCLRALVARSGTSGPAEDLVAGRAEARPDGTLTGTLRAGARTYPLRCRP